MSKIIRQDTNGVKPLLAVGELGYDNYPSGGDIGRVYVGTGSSNIAQAKKSEVVTVDGKVDTHVARIDNPHAVTKAHVGLSNVDNTSDANKPVSTSTQNALDLKQNVLVSGANIKTIEGQSIVGPGNIDLSKAHVGLSNVDNTADSAKVVDSAGKWTTSRLINGTAVDGTIDITTSQWGISRNITIGNTAKSVNGSADTSWSLAEIGAIGTASPAFTGVPTAPTATVNTNTTQLATTAFVNAEIANDAIPRVTSINTAIPKFDGVSGAIQSSNILINSSDNVILPKASGGSLTISLVDGVTNTEVIIPESGILATKQYVDASIGQLSTDYYQGPYGISWDYATDTYTRTGAKGYTAIQSLMRRCVVKADGTVNYYLNPDNSNFKEDGTPSVLTGADGNVMVEIPKHYIKVETVGNVDSLNVSLTPEAGYVLDPAFLKWNGTAMVEVPYRYFRAYEGFVSGGKLLSVSGVTPTASQTIATFRTQAMANGAGWHLTDWNLLNTIKRLCYIEFCDFIVTKYLGNGNDTGSDYGITTGQSNALGNRSSNSTHNDKYMSYRGIENMYADIWEFVDGVNVNNYQFYVNGKYSTFQSDVFTGDYVVKGPLIVAGASNSLIKRCAVSSDGGFIPTVVGGSTTTFYGDALWSRTGARVALYGGNAYDGASAGLGALGVYYASSDSAVDIGAAVCR